MKKGYTITKLPKMYDSELIGESRRKRFQEFLERIFQIID